MLNRSLPALILTAAVGWLLMDLLVVFPRLPEWIATHFNTAGAPNGWSSRMGILGLIAPMMAMFVAMFVAAGQLHRLPNALINVPRKDYWLAPERRDATCATLRDAGRWGLAVVMSCEAFVMSAAMRANLSPRPQLSLDAGMMTVALVALSMGMIVWMLWRFRVPSETAR